MIRDFSCVIMMFAVSGGERRQRVGSCGGTELCIIDMRVDLRGIQIFMPEYFLECPDVHAV